MVTRERSQLRSIFNHTCKKLERLGWLVVSNMFSDAFTWNTWRLVRGPSEHLRSIYIPFRYSFTPNAAVKSCRSNFNGGDWSWERQGEEETTCEKKWGKNPKNEENKNTWHSKPPSSESLPGFFSKTGLVLMDLKPFFFRIQGKVGIPCDPEAHDYVQVWRYAQVDRKCFPPEMVKVT